MRTMRSRNRSVPALLAVVVVVAMLALPGSSTFVAEAQSGRRLVVGLPADPVGLDAHQTSTAVDRMVYPALYDRLVTQDANGKVVPELALKWEVSSDGLTWTFDLRPGHQFHDGAPVTAEAVRASFQRLIDPRTASPQRSLLEVVKEIQVVGPNRIAFKTEGPAPYFVTLLTQNATSIVNVAAAQAAGSATFNRNPVGSGPYRFKEWARGTRLVFERNPFHWQTFLRRSNVDVLEFRPIPDAATRAIALETGEVDFLTTLEPEDAKRLSSNQNLKIYNLPRSRLVALYPDFRKRPFNNLRVRQAIAHAINKQTLVNTFQHGFAQVSQSPITPGIWSRKVQPAVEFNPDRARALLREAGYPNGLTTNLMVPVGQLGAIRQVAEATSEMLKAVGITANLQLMEHAAWQAVTRRGPTESPLELSFWTWGNVIGDPDYSMRQTFASENWAPRCCNRNFYRNSQADRFIAQATIESNPEKRAALYGQAQDVVWRDLAWIYLYDINHVSAGKKTVENVVIPPTEFWVFRDARIRDR